MPNLAGVLKEEIRRLARKEAKSQVEATKKANAQYRRDIASLKRQIQDLEKQLRHLRRQDSRRVEEEPEDNGIPPGTRFSARSVRAQRRKLGFSAEEYGNLIGVSGQTIYLWEQGKSRPRNAQLAKLVAIRNIGKREARRMLESSDEEQEG